MDHPEVAHQLPGPSESVEVADLGAEPSAEACQCRADSAAARPRRPRAIPGSGAASAAPGCRGGPAARRSRRCCLRARSGDRFREFDAGQPLPVRLRPVVAAQRTSCEAATPDAVAPPHQIAAQVLPGPDQIAQRLFVGRRNPDGCSSRPSTARQPLSVAAVGLDPVLRRPRDLARRRDHAPHAHPVNSRASPNPVAQPHRPPSRAGNARQNAAPRSSDPTTARSATRPTPNRSSQRSPSPRGIQTSPAATCATSAPP